jgi:hypothetical protein
MDTVPIDGTIVIGEGERDEAPMLYIGEKVGMAHALGPAALPQVDIAVDPLEGTNLCATGAPTRSRCSRRRTRAACCTRPTSTWRSWSSAELEGRGQPRRAGADNLQAIAQCLGRESRTSS